MSQKRSRVHALEVVTVANDKHLNKDEDIHLQTDSENRLNTDSEANHLSSPKGSDKVQPLNGVDIAFQNLNYQITVQDKQKSKWYSKSYTQRHILKGVSGICKHGQATAILGSSGAGKTSLLNILSMRAVTSGNVKVTGDLLANGKPYDGSIFTGFANYVMQDDRLFEVLTPRECFIFAASLKTKSDYKTKMEMAEQMIRFMKLERAADTMVGGPLIKGISGGERKRTSIGYELITDPTVLLLDEPTSGLDSFTAYLIIYLLKKYAQDKGRTVIFTIHQPNSDIWRLFDQIMLLVEGRLIYQGPGDLEIINQFSNMGFNCPKDSSPGDQFMSIMHHDEQKNVDNYPLQFENYEQQIAPKVIQEIREQEQGEVQARISKHSFFYETQLLAHRSWLMTIRNPVILKGRIAQAVVMGLITGLLYLQLSPPLTIIDLQDRIGFLFFMCMTMFMLQLGSTVLTFPLEKGVFLKEENAKMYSMSSYYLGKVIIDTPFIFAVPIVFVLIVYWMVGLADTVGQFWTFYLICALLSNCGAALGVLLSIAISDPKAIMGVIPIVVLPFALFSGFYKNSSDYPAWIGWFEYISPFYYGLEAFILNEFENLQAFINPVQQYRLTMGCWNSIWIILGMAIILRILSLISLKLATKRIQ